MRSLSLVLLLAAAICVSGRQFLQDGGTDDLVKDENGFLLGEGGEIPPSVACSAFSILKITATAGRCMGTASAECEAVSESQSTYVNAYKDWWIGEDGNLDETAVCAGETVEVFAKAVATAIAKVWTTAVVKVECEGQGFACGWAASNGEALAMAFAEALAFAAADASLPDVDAFCVADVRAVAGAIAEAASKSQADACTSGGAAADFEADFSAAIVSAIAEAFAQATASVCNLDDTAKAASECFGVADSGVLEQVVGDASTDQLKACEGGAQTCCGTTNRICRCEDCMGPLRRMTMADDMGTQESWRDSTGTVCFCI